MYRPSRHYVPAHGYNDHDPYYDPRRQGPRRSATYPGMVANSRRDSSGNGESWVTRVDSDDPRLKTGIRYFPETDSFRIPRGKRAGPFVGPEEVPGRLFVRMFPEGNTADLRRRRLEEYRSTGRVENRGAGVDRFGRPWVSGSEVRDPLVG